MLFLGSASARSTSKLRLFSTNDMYLVCASLLYAVIAATSCDSNEIRLGGAWTLFGHNVTVLATVPGCIHTDLQRSGIIGDPLYRMNDIEYKWIGLTNWSYTRVFNVSLESLDSDGVDLVCEGLDTVASIKINDVVIGAASNMHRKYVFDIKDVVKSGRNSITIDFTSPVTYVAEQKAHYPYYVPPEPNFNFIRKAAYSFGWDWGPSLPSTGIWKDIYIKSYKVSLREVKIQTFADSEIWTLKLTSYFDMAKKRDGAIVTMSFMIKELNMTRKELVYLKPSNLIHETHINLDKQIVELWWPHGMGNARLYQLEVNICDKPACEGSRQFYIGFRKVELIQEKVNYSQGLTFYFKVNDVPVFCKGANWIPAGSFQGSIDDDQVLWLLESAVNANMNILRVWGGGVYESEKFYELADKLGILIWQDFMFACALYPTDLDFLENVREEVVYQVRRLSHHPSIIIWAGNNENEAALMQNWFNISDEMMDTFKKDYIRLYVDYIRDAVINEDLSRQFVTSSPSNGLKTIMDGWLSPQPQNESFGDVHFYNYLIDGWIPNDYPVPRFASEFGFQSWPSLETLLPISIEEDLQFNSSFSKHRQRHTNGNEEMRARVEFHMEFPAGSNATTNFIHYAYLTQVDQAMSIKAQTEHYLRHQLSVLEDGRGLTMGAMYWQLNDVWQAPTWSSIEYGGKWKMLHYYARKFFSDYLVSPTLQNGRLIAYFINSNGLAQSNCRNFSLKILCFNYYIFRPSRKWEVEFQQFKTVDVIYEDYIYVMTSKCGCSKPKFCFFEFHVFSECDGTMVADNVLFVENYFSKIPSATVTVKSVIQVDSKTMRIKLCTNNFAFFVWIEAVSYKGSFSENGFLMTSPTREIVYTSRYPILDMHNFSKSLLVTSVSDTFH